MTTIAYNHKDKQIAVDSQTSRDNIIVSLSADKVDTVDGVKFIACGATCDIPNLIGAYFGKEYDKSLSCVEAFVIDDSKAYKISICKEDGFWKHELKFNDATGCGEQFALSALLNGASAKEAVEHAIKLDCYTGGEVQVIDI